MVVLILAVYSSSFTAFSTTLFTIKRARLEMFVLSSSGSFENSPGYLCECVAYMTAHNGNGEKKQQ